MAFHEAGHVLIHEIFDWPYTDVSVAEVGKEGVNYSYPDPQKDSPAQEKLIYACICCAGAVAEDKFNFPADTPREDLGKSFYLRNTEGSDYEKYSELNLPPMSSERIMDDIVIDMILENWDSVSEIAQALHAKKRLSSNDVKQTLVKANFMRSQESCMQSLLDIQKTLGI
ncbi:hypothetical protein U2F10_07315 [Leptothoe sp. EHU-05/26/07-4]